jgi:glycosyltransferase involved in cell wall biosynthesis
MTVKVTLGMLTWMSGSGHLEKTLDSILQQTYRDFELIILDDCSHDNPLTLINRLVENDGRVKFIRSNYRLGMSKASQRLLSEAEDKTDFFAWISDHDIYDPSWLENLLDSLLINPKAAVAFPLVQGIDEIGLRNNRKPTIYNNANQNKYQRVRSLSKLSSGSGNIIYGLFRYSMLIKIGGWPTLIEPDYLLLLRISALGCIIQVPLFLLKRRDQNERLNHKGSLVSRQIQGIFPNGSLIHKYVDYRIINSAYLFYLEPISSICIKEKNFFLALYIWYRYTFVKLILFIKRFIWDLFINTHTRTFYRSIKRFLSERLYKYNFDNLSTDNNLGVLQDERFLKAYNRAVLSTGVDLKIPLRIHQAVWCSQYALDIEGDFLELGTGKGFTFSAVLEYLSNFSSNKIQGKNIFLVDTFLPNKPDTLTGIQNVTFSGKIPLAYSNDESAVIKNFSEWSNVKVIKGFLPSILSDFVTENFRISFMHVDLNHHVPEISTLNSIWKHMSIGAVILIDDYANPGRDMQRRAHDQFFMEKGLSILTLASGQGLVLVGKKLI